MIGGSNTLNYRSFAYTVPYATSTMLDQRSLHRRRSANTIGCYLLLLASLLFSATAGAVTEAKLQQERETLKVYERRIPSLLTAMRSLDRQLAALQQQRDSVDRKLDELTRTYLTRQREYEQAQAAATASNDKNAKAAAEHSQFQYYLVERKLTKLQSEAEQLEADMAPLKQSLQDRQRRLQRSEKKIAAQKDYVRKLASATPTNASPSAPERIEIKSRNKAAVAQPSLPASSPPNTTLATTTERNKQNTAVSEKPKAAATDAERRYASAQSRRLQALLADAKSGKPAAARAKTLEVQHKDEAGVKHLYDLTYIGENHYTTEGTVHAGKHVFKVAKQRWITNIPARDDGANYVFVLNATPHRRLELIMYNAALAEQPPQQPKKTALSKK